MLSVFAIFTDMAFSLQIQENQGLSTIQLTDNAGTSAEIFSLGGILNRFIIEVEGKPVNLVAGFENVKEAQEKIGMAFQGARLSPFVCRLRNGSYNWLGKNYRIEKKYMGEHAIHGLMYDTPFDVVETRCDEKKAVVVLEGSYRGDDQGYPFPYRVRLEWSLKKEASLTVCSTVWHENEIEIPIAEGWHPYFSLGGKTDEWELQFNTHRQMEYDKDLLPTGHLISDMRFIQGASLEGVHLDNGFVFSEDEREEYKCVLRSREIELTIQPDRSFPVLQVFTPDDRRSIALENLSGAPDNFNNQLLLISLPPYEMRYFKTSYKASSRL
jgi:aldose 1-epimerase